MSEENGKSKITFCPNCQQPAIRSGNDVTCEKCDAVFVITQKQGPKVKKLGPLEEINQRLQRLETLLPGENLEPEAENDPADHAVDEDENESPILPG